MKTKQYFAVLAFVAMLAGFAPAGAYAQETPTDTIRVENMTLDHIRQLTYDELLEMPLEDLAVLVNKFKVSSIEELYQKALNPEQSIASKQTESSFESPLSTTVVTRHEIERSGATCLEEVLALVPGFIIRQKTNGNYDVHIRGNDNVPPGEMLIYSANTMTLVMIDNRIVYNYFQGGTDWPTLPVGVNDLERVEVIRGPSSALYGPNAVSGVIHFITKNPDSNELRVNADLQVGNAGTKTGHLSTSFGLGKAFKARFSGNYLSKDRFQSNYHTWGYGSLTLDELDTAFTGYPYSIDSLFDNAKLSTRRYSANAFLLFDPAEKVSFDLSFGVESSENQTVYIDAGPSALSVNESNSMYSSLNAEVYGFKANVSFRNGTQDAYVGMPGFRYDFSTLDTKLEYHFKHKNFSLIPGVWYQKALYDDSPYVDLDEKTGFLNGEKELSSAAFSLRADYTAFDKLRLIAALRNEGYNTTDKRYTSWQFISLYKIDDNNLIRFVYSRANRSPFMSDTYADYHHKWEQMVYDQQGNVIIDPQTGNPMIINGVNHFSGNENLDFATMDMYELGFRSKLLENLHSDVEFFFTETSDFAVAKFLSQTVDLNNDPEVVVSEQYDNLGLTAHQVGMTASLTAVLNKKWQMKAFATLQRTYMTDFRLPVFLGEGHPTSIDDFDFIVVDLEHRSTPEYFGGFTVNFQPTTKWNFNLSSYFYGDQKFLHGSPAEETLNEIVVEKKISFTAKISYKFWKNNALYFNLRNFPGNDKQEFAYGDKNKGLYLVGLNINF